MEPPLISGKNWFSQSRKLRDFFPEFSQKPLGKAPNHNIWCFNTVKPRYSVVFQSIGFIVGIISSISL